MRERLGVRAPHREIDELDGVSVLREGEEAYGPDPGVKMRSLTRVDSESSINVNETDWL